MAKKRDPFSDIKRDLSLPACATLGECVDIVNGDRPRRTMQETLDWAHERQVARRILRERGLIKQGPAVRAFHEALRREDD